MENKNYNSGQYPYQGQQLGNAVCVPIVERVFGGIRT